MARQNRRNPYLNKRGEFMEARWLRDAQGRSKLDQRFLNYATSQGYTIRSDRDRNARPGQAFNSGPNGRVGTFQFSNGNVKGGSRFYARGGALWPLWWRRWWWPWWPWWRRRCWQRQ